MLGEKMVGGVNDGRPITVGTERDLVGIESQDLAVVVEMLVARRWPVGE